MGKVNIIVLIVVALHCGSWLYFLAAQRENTALWVADRIETHKQLNRIECGSESKCGTE